MSVRTLDYLPFNEKSRSLPKELSDTIISHLSGKRLEFFKESLAAINDSLLAGGWVGRSSQKVDKGFHQGCWTRPILDRSSKHYDVAYCLWRGYGGVTAYEVEMALSELSDKELKKCPHSLVRAWCELVELKNDAVIFLNMARRLPVVTGIGLSPRVTATLKEINLDLDLSSIKIAKMDFRMVPRLNANPKSPDYMKPLVNRDGSVIMMREYFVVWSSGIIHNMSRFTRGCQACGKNIPSRRYVPIEAQDKKSGSLISMWVGCDCAKNIFGIKDDGIGQG